MVEIAEQDSATLLELGLAVELGPTLEDLAQDSGSGAEFREALGRHIDRLITGLGLPVTPSLTVATAPAEPAVTGRYRLRIAGVSCVPVLPAELGEEDVGPGQLAADVARTIALNRRHCLTPEVAESLLQAWQAFDPRLEGVITDDAFKDALAELLLRCVSVAPRPVEALEVLGGPLDPSSSTRQLCNAILAEPDVVSLRVFVGPGLASAIAPVPEPSPRPYSSDVPLALASTTISEVLHDETGFLVPSVEFEVDSALDDAEFCIQVNDMRFPPTQGLAAGEAMVNATLDALGPDSDGARGRSHPTHGMEAAVVDVDDDALAALGAAGYATWGPEGYIAFSLAREVRRLARALLHPDVMRFHLDRVKTTYPAVVEAALQRFGFDYIDAVVRQLLDEQISIHDLTGILEGMLAVNGSVAVDQSRYRLITPNAAALWPRLEGSDGEVPGVDEYADCVRRHLRSQLTSKYSGGGGTVPTLAVDERLEARLRLVSTQPLEEEERERLSASVWAAYEPYARGGSPPVVLTNSEVRRVLSRLLAVQFPSLPVVSRDELGPGTRVQTSNRILWD